MVRVLIAVAVAALRIVNLPLRLRRRRNVLLLISRQYRSTSADYSRIIDELADVSPGTTAVVLNHRATANPVVNAWHILVQMWHLSVARAVIVDTYIIPVSVLPPVQGRPVVQIWHAIGAIKKFGLASVGTAEGASSMVATGMFMHRGYTAVACGGEWARELFAEGFNVPLELVALSGQPRHDSLVDQAAALAGRKRIAEHYPQLSGARPVIVYAPTMRRGTEVDLTGFHQAVATLDAHIVISLHPLDDRTIIPDSFIDGRNVSTSDWLTVADHVITDYSAIGLEAAVVGVPVWFYPYDIGTYQKSPGLFVDPVHHLPAITRTTATELGELLSSNLHSQPAAEAQEAWQRLQDGFGAGADGGATRRLLGLCEFPTSHGEETQ